MSIRYHPTKEFVDKVTQDWPNPPDEKTKEKVRQKIDDAIDAAIAPKVVTSLRLSVDVLQFFKKDGPGYQKRINAVLKDYVDDQTGHGGTRQK